MNPTEQPAGARASERGQSLVLIVLSLVAMLGFAALALDLGQLYAARRSAQNAADAAALAAAYEAAGGSGNHITAINKGYNQARANGYDNNRQNNWVNVYNPPIDGPYCATCGVANASQYFQVKITLTVQPIFAQFVFRGAQITTVNAVVRATAADVAGGGDALKSLSGDYDSLLFDGNTGVSVSNGNIRSNGGMIKRGASGSVTVDEGGIYYDTTFTGHTSPLSPAPQQQAAVPIGAVTPPYCPSAADLATWYSGSSFKYNILNGVHYYYYPNGLSVSNLAPGIHCINGGIPKGNFSGQDVLLVLLSGGIKQNGGDSLSIIAASDMKDIHGTQWGGMAIFVPPSNTSEIYFGGNASAYFYGTVYAPGATCDIGGNPNGTAYNSAFICNKIKIHGNPTIYIDYNPAQLFHFSPFIHMMQ